MSRPSGTGLSGKDLTSRKGEWTDSIWPMIYWRIWAWKNQPSPRFTIHYSVRKSKADCSSCQLNFLSAHIKWTANLWWCWRWLLMVNTANFTVVQYEFPVVSCNSRWKNRTNGSSRYESHPLFETCEVEVVNCFPCQFASATAVSESDRRTVSTIRRHRDACHGSRRSSTKEASGDRAESGGVCAKVGGKRREQHRSTL